MATAKKKLDMKLNFKGPDLASIGDQFKGLQGKHPGLWPALPKTLLLFGIFLALLALVYGAYVRSQLEELEQGRQQEDKLKLDYKDRIKKAVNLDLLKRQKEEVGQFVTTLEKQLPSKSEMDALLSDINQAGVGRGLQFELFKPGSVVAREYYAELPIEVKVVGQYHDIGSFTSDIANLPRIVTLNNVVIEDDPKNSLLTMKATAKTFRYLDPEEIAAAKKEAAKKNPPAAAPATGGAK
jgi:type IV pilus assembly protein PilO